MGQLLGSHSPKSMGSVMETLTFKEKGKISLSVRKNFLRFMQCRQWSLKVGLCI